MMVRRPLCLLDYEKTQDSVLLLQGRSSKIGLYANSARSVLLNYFQHEQFSRSENSLLGGHNDRARV